MTDGLDDLIATLHARLLHGVTIVGDRPFIHGVPAKFDPEPPLIPEALTQWRCPHCDAHLSSRGYICLNACHLSAPQLRDFQSEMREVFLINERGQRLLRGLRFSTFPEDYAHYRRLLVVKDMRLHYENEYHHVIIDWVREQAWRGHVGVSTKIGIGNAYALFDDEADRMMFILRWKGEIE